jgi:hypothetical protein
VITYEIEIEIEIGVGFLLQLSTALFRTIHRTFWHRTFYRDGLAHPYT